jgi:PAS domain S-box-containing protein
MIILGLLQNVALLIALAAAYQIIGARFRQRSIRYNVLSGLLFGAVGIIGMMSPVTFAPGVILDGRSIIMAVAGFIGGPIVALVAAITNCLFRWFWIGGSGAFIGVLVVLEAALFGVLFHEWHKRRDQRAQPFFLWGMGLIVHIAMLGLFALIPDVGMTMIQATWLVVLIAYPIATMLICLLFQDYESQLQDKQTLQRNEAYLSHLFETSPAVVFSMNPATLDINFVSPNIGTILGFTRDDVMKPNWWINHLHPSDVRLTPYDETDLSYDQIERQYRFHTKTRDVVWIRDVMKVIRDEHGLPNEIIATWVDITKQKNADDALRVSQEQLQISVDGSELALWDWNLKTGEVSVNERWANIVGYTKAELNPISIQTWDKLIHPDDSEVSSEAIDRHIRNETPIMEAEVRMKHKEGHWVWILDRGKVIEWDEDGSAVRMAGTHLDITKRKVMELEREHLLAELVRSNNELKQFSFIISHNLRGPLASMRGLLNLMREEPIPDGNLSELINGFEISTKQLTDTIQTLNEILVIRNTGALELKSIRFDRILNNVLDDHSYLIQEMDIEWDVDFEQAPSITFNEAYLHSILLNLISNGIKYRSPKRNLLLSLRTHIDESGIVLTFSDNGLGLDVTNKKDTLFGLYQRFHSDVDGKGLGLYMTRAQIEALGGTILVDGAVDQGLTFTIHFNRHENI